MKIFLVSPNKESFETEIQPESTILDLKKIIIERFGLSDNAIPKVRIIHKQQIQRDDNKMLTELGVTEGNTINYYIPKALESQSKSTPSQSNPNEKKTTTKQSDSNEAKPTPTQINPNETKHAPAAPTNSTETKESNPSQKEQKEDIKKPPPSNYFDYYNNKHFPDPNCLNQLLEMGYDEGQAKTCLRMARNNINVAIDYLNNKFYQENADRFEKFVNGQLSQSEKESLSLEYIQSGVSELRESLQAEKPHHRYPAADPNALNQLKEMGYDERKAEIMLRLYSNNINSVLGIINYSFFDENIDRLEKLLNNELSQEEISELCLEMVQFCQAALDNSQSSYSMFGQNSMFGQQNPNDSSQNEFANLLKQHMPQDKRYIVDVKMHFIEKIKAIPSQSPEEFVNPFIESKEMLEAQNKTNDQFYNFVEVSSKFNRDQILFMIEYTYSHRVPFETVAFMLDASNGNIEEAKALLNSQ